MNVMFDAVVMGGGPAGGMAALLLARLGWRVALVERGPRYREKACGDCLNVRAGGALRRSGLEPDVQRLAVGTTRRLRVHLERREPIVAALPEDPDRGPGLLVDRGRFDQLLRDRAADAGVHVLQPARAQLDRSGGPAVTVRPGEGTPAQRLRCGLIVGADGLRSAVARSAGLAAGGSTGRKYGFAFDVPVTEGADAIKADTIEMFVVADGYLGVVRRQAGGNGGGQRLHVAGLVGGTGRTSSAPLAFVNSVAGRFDELAGAGLERLPTGRSSRLLGAGPMPCRPGAVADGRVALVGDAAGYVEPFTGEGMSWALESAEILAAVAADLAPGAWSAAAARRYRRAWARRIGRRQRHCAVLAAILGRPAVSRALFAVAARRAGLVNVLVRRAVMP